MLFKIILLVFLDFLLQIFKIECQVNLNKQFRHFKFNQGFKVAKVVRNICSEYAINKRKAQQ